MKKLSLLFILATTYVLNLSAQSQKLKVDLDVFYINYDYVQLPETSVPEDKRTYKVFVNNGTDYHWIYRNDIFAEKIFVNGFKQDENASVRIEVQLENLLIVDNGIKSKENKDKNGNVTSVDYTSTVKTTGTGKYTITYNGNRKDYPLSFTNTNSQTFKDNSSASSYYWNNRSTFKQTDSRAFAEQAINEIFSTVNRLYGYRIFTDKVNFEVVNNDDNPEYAEHQAAFKKIKEVLGQIQYNTDVTTLREEFKETIKFYDGIKNKYTDEKDRKHTKMKYASYNNIAAIYFILDMFEESKKEADGLIANGMSERVGEDLKQRASVQQKLTKTSNLTIRHTEVDPLYLR